MDGGNDDAFVDVARSSKKIRALSKSVLRATLPFSLYATTGI